MSDESVETAFSHVTLRTNSVSTLVHIVVGMVILSTVASSSAIFSSPIGDAVAVLCYLLLAGYFVYRDGTVSLPRYPLLILLLIYTIFVVNAIRIFTGLLEIPGTYSSASSPEFYFLYLASMGAFIISSFVTVFVIPAVIDRERIFILFSLLSATTVLIGIPAYVVGDFQISWIRVHTYTHLQPFREFGVFIPALASYFADANAFSKIALAGSFASFYQYRRYGTITAKVLFGVNAIGLFLGNSRTALLAAAAAATMYVTYVRLGKTSLRVFVTAVGAVGITGFLLLLAEPSAIPFISSLNFSGRLELWQGSVQAIVQNPVLGAGVYEPSEIVVSYTSSELRLAPQNSYLRMFITAGAVGGLAYISLLGVLLYRHLSTLKNRPDAVMFAFFVAFLIVQLTDTANPFGINKNSMIFGLLLGYVIEDVYL